MVDKAEFITSATEPSGWPESEIPEIAFAGRSNVGKSSMINTLVRRRNLVRVSGRPGRTQLINFFRVDGELMLVDLPGYGFAAVPDEVKDSWQEMIESYLAGRPHLQGLVCIMDLRRGVEEDDLQLIHAAPHFGLQPILVFTKADKLKKNARNNRRFQLADQIGCPPDELLFFSSTKKFGIRELWKRVNDLCGTSIRP